MSFKSKFEEDVAKKKGLTNVYEVSKVTFTQPQKRRTYTPDFTPKDGIHIECKGRFTAADRQKMLWVREQNPGLTFLLLFQNSSVRLSRSSKTTYGMWATKNGFDWWDWRDGWPKKWNKYLRAMDSSSSTDQPS